MPGPLPHDFAHTLAQKLRDDQLVLFAGAGLSMQAIARDGSGRKMPGWGALLEGVAAQFGLDPAHYRTDRLSLLDAAEIKAGRAALNDVVRQIIADEAFAPGDAHAALRALPWAAVCTTNYDTLLDRCLEAPPVVTEDDFRAQMRLPRMRSEKLFKLHGSLDNPHTLTARDYKRWAERHPVAHHFVKDLLVRDTFLFVGYSLSDPHWKALLDLVEQFVGTDEKWLYALVWQASDAELEPLRLIHRINGAGLHDDSDYAAAFRQVHDALDRLANPTTPPAAGPAAFSYDRAQYAQAVRRTYGYADLGAIYQWGAGFGRDDVSLAEIFVAPDLLMSSSAKLPAEDTTKVAEPDEDLTDLERERRRHARQPETEREHRRPAATVATESEHLLIVGAPGQGKSTLLRHLLLEATERWLADPLGQPFPCLVRLSQWAEVAGPPEGRLLRYLIAHLPGFAEISQDAAAAWHATKMLWLLDGIDEIRGTAARERFQEDLVRLASPGSRHRFVVSTRPAGEPRGGLGAEWLRCELPTLAESQVLGILRNWSAVLAKKDALHLDAADFAARLARNSGLRQVRGNALLLTMAVLFFKQRKRLPNDRWEFYEGAEQALRDSWARHRLSDKDAASLPGDYAATVLESLALDGMREGRVLFTTDQVAASVRSVLTGRSYTGGEQDAEVPHFLDAARDAIGVLVEQAPDRFGFVHLTFQEFLAARALVKRGEDAPRIIARFWDHPDWRETWLLYSLGCQSLQGRFADLLDIILRPEARDAFWSSLRRQERAVLRLAGVGTENLPPSGDPALAWAAEVLGRGSISDQWMVLNILAAWERTLPSHLRDLLIQRLRSRDFLWRRAAVQALTAQADNVTVRLALLTACKDRSVFVRMAASSALAASSDNTEVRRALIDARKDRSPSVRAAAVEALAGCANDITVRAALLQSSEDKNSAVRLAAVRAVASLGDDPTIFPTLFETTKDQYAIIRNESLRILSDCTRGTVGRAIVLDATRDGRLFVRRAALQALGSRTEIPEVLKILFDAAGDGHWSVRQASIRALSSSARKDHIRAVLLAAAADRAAQVRSAAVLGLAGYASDETVCAAVLHACQDRNWSVREAAALALAEYSDGAIVRATLYSLCGDPVGSVRAAAVRALAEHVDDADVRRVLLHVARQRDGWGDYYAINALAGRGDDEDVRDALLFAMGAGPSYARSAPIEALATSAGDPTVMAALLRAANQGEMFIRGQAFHALAPYADRTGVRRALLAGMRDDEEYVRRKAVESLAARVNDAQVRAALLITLKDDEWTVRRAGVKALAGCAGDSEVSAALVTICQDHDQDVSQAAVQALEEWIVKEKFPRTAIERRGSLYAT